MDDITTTNETTTQEAAGTIEENKEMEKTRAQKKEERKQAREQIEAQKRIAKEAGLEGAERENVTENGASLEFSDISDEELATIIEEMSSNELNADGLGMYKEEQQKRQKYQAGKKALQQFKENRSNIVNGIIDGAGRVFSLSGSLFATDSESTDARIQKRGAVSGVKYLKDKRFRAIAADNNNRFGDRTDEQKRRFKKFAKRV